VQDQEYFDIVRQARGQIAAQDKVPAFVVFGNASHMDMVEKNQN